MSTPKNASTATELAPPPPKRNKSGPKSIEVVLREVAVRLDTQAERAFGNRDRGLADEIQAIAIRCTETASRAEVPAADRPALNPPASK